MNLDRMPNGDRINSAEQILDDLSIDHYPLFDDSVQSKNVAIWQPTGRVDGLFEFPQPEATMRSKADEFIRKSYNDCHLAVAPEWSYSVNWIPEHSEELFSDENALFVLGCSPMEHEEMESVIETLQDDFTCIPSEVPQDGSTRFVTPTVIPIRAVAENGHSTTENVLLFQYKNCPMGDSANWNEETNMTRGEFVWKIDPVDQTMELLVLTCSDILDYDLKQEAQTFARSTDCIVAHVQCNPEPFHDEWTRFREEIFSAESFKTTYVSANWAWIRENGADEPIQMGYSGVYSKARKDTPFSKYDMSYSNGGLPGSNPDVFCEYLWLFAADSISNVGYKRADPGGAGSAGPSFSDIHVSETLIWDGSTFIETQPGIPECENAACKQWRGSLPDEPINVELISSIALGGLMVDEIPRNREGSFHPMRDLRWPVLSNLRCDDSERLSHILADHPHRSGPAPVDLCSILNDVFELAELQENLRPMQEYGIDEVPANAEYIDEDTDTSVCLTIVDQISEDAYRRRKDWIGKWLEISDRPFKSFIAQIDTSSGLTIQPGPDHEHVDRSPTDPRSVDASGSVTGEES